MTAADGRATDAALGQSGTPTPATPRRGAPRGRTIPAGTPAVGPAASTESGSASARAGDAGVRVGAVADADGSPRGSAPAQGHAGMSAESGTGVPAVGDGGGNPPARRPAPAPAGTPAPQGASAFQGTPTAAPAGTPPPVDTMAAVVRQWQAVHPGIDTGPMEIIGRINRSAALLQQAEDAPLRRAGLTRPEFDVLGTLRRTGHELTPSEIARETFASGAAVTKRLKQLTERGLVERRGDTRDRRVAHVRLTDAGRDLVDAVLPQQLAYETTALSGIDLARQRELADLLGELLGQLEGRLGMPHV